MSVCLDAALSILIPMGVVLYAVSGGLKATFTTSYIYTVIIFVVLCVFMFKTYCGGGELGSISKVTPKSLHVQYHAYKPCLTRLCVCMYCLWDAASGGCSHSDAPGGGGGTFCCLVVF